MDLHYRQEITVGTLVLAGVGLFLGGTMWLRGRSFSTAPEVQVVFPEVGTLKRGSPVKVSGVTLGSVERIEFQEVGKVLVTLSLSAEVRPKIDASARLTSVGLVGDMAINFLPGTSTEPLPPDRPIQGTVDQGLTALGNDLGAQAKEVMTGVQEVANKRLAEDLHQTLVAMRRTLEVYSDTRKGPTTELTGTLQSLQRLANRLDSTLATVHVDPTLKRADTLVTSLNTLTTRFSATGAQLDTLLRRINSGRGTLGKFAQDTTFYDNAQRLLRSLQEFVDELKKHPGKITVQIKVW